MILEHSFWSLSLVALGSEFLEIPGVLDDDDIYTTHALLTYHRSCTTCLIPSDHVTVERSIPIHTLSESEAL